MAVRLLLTFFMFSFILSCQNLPPEAYFIEQNKIVGAVDVDKGLKGKCDGFLFIIVRKLDSPQPLAVKRIKSPEYPYQFVLSPADVMIDTGFQLFQGELLLHAKTSKSGNPFEEGDYCESDIIPVKTGASGIKIIINTYRD